jgi:argininosuccinate synthase
MKNKKVVLAFSGGLDTSFCAVYLRVVKQLEVHAVMVNTGGFTAGEMQQAEERAISLGVSSFTALEETDAYYHSCVRFLIYGNVLKNNVYPLSVSAERVSQAKAIALFAQKINAGFVAHGSTGAGNDQVRFDMVFHHLIPEIEILTPVRDLRLSREEEIAFLEKHGVKINSAKAIYSVNKGLWGTSVGGKETLTSGQYLPEDAFPSPLKKNTAENISLEFFKGELKKVNEKEFENPVQAIQHLQEIAAEFAIGRDMHIGDTIIGIKGRVGFEAAAPMIILKAHHALEKHVLTKWQLFLKDQLANWYGQFLHEGQFFDPAMRNLEAFFESSQENVSGKVFVTLYPYRFVITGIDSPHDMMSPEFGSYGEMNRSWSGDDVKGFSKIFGNNVSVFNKVNKLPEIIS